MSELKVTTLKHADSTVDSIVMASDGTLAFGAAVADSAGVAVKGGVPAQAWVNFNGQGTVAIRRAFNVSSVTDNGTADYTINFTTSMPDVSYAAVTGGLPSVGSTIGEIINIIEINTGSVRLRTFYTYSNQAKTYYDAARVSLAIFS